MASEKKQLRRLEARIAEMAASVVEWRDRALRAETREDEEARRADSAEVECDRLRVDLKRAREERDAKNEAAVVAWRDCSAAEMLAAERGRRIAELEAELEAEGERFEQEAERFEEEREGLLDQVRRCTVEAASFRWTLAAVQAELERERGAPALLDGVRLRTLVAGPCEVEVQLVKDGVVLQTLYRGTLLAPENTLSVVRV